MMKVFHLLLLVCVFAAGHVKAQTYTGPNALGPFRIDKDVRMASLFQLLGSPSSMKRDSFCYRSRQGEGFLRITRMVEVYDAQVAGSVVLSSFPNCVKQPVQSTSEELTAWKTEDAIGLSSTAEDVRKSYGKPSKEVKIEGTKFRWVIHGDRVNDHYAPGKRPEIGDTVLIYQSPRNELRVAEFGIRNGKVVWIFLSNDE